MEASQIKSIVEGSGYSLNIAQRIPELRSILLQTVQSIHLSDTITFDSTNNLVKIKYYDSKVVSGFISDYNLDSTKMILTSKKSFIYYMDRYYAFRKPKTGDIVYLVNSSGVIQTKKYTIASSSSSFIALSEKLVDYDHTKLSMCYADPAYFTNAISAPGRPLVLIYFSPVTSFTVDTYLDYSKIVGFEMRSNRVGSNGVF